jgi:hypothetical protein
VDDALSHARSGLTILLPAITAAQQIRGVVVEDSTGLPISGATIELLAADATVRATTSSAVTGWFELNSDGVRPVGEPPGIWWRHSGVVAAINRPSSHPQAIGYRRFAGWCPDSAGAIVSVHSDRQMRQCIGLKGAAPMSTISTVMIGMAACGLTAGCAARNPNMPLRNVLVTAQQALITANNAADITAVAALTADDWIGIDASGVRTTKADLAASIQNRGAAAIQASPEQLARRQQDWIVRVYDNVGIVTRLTAGDHGNRQWITTVWVMRANSWKRVLSQVTNAPPQ